MENVGFRIYFGDKVDRFFVDFIGFWEWGKGKNERWFLGLFGREFGWMLISFMEMEKNESLVWVDKGGGIIMIFILDVFSLVELLDI